MPASKHPWKCWQKDAKQCRLSSASLCHHHHHLHDADYDNHADDDDNDDDEDDDDDDGDGDGEEVRKQMMRRRSQQGRRERGPTTLKKSTGSRCKLLKKECMLRGKGGGPSVQIKKEEKKRCLLRNLSPHQDLHFLSDFFVSTSQATLKIYLGRPSHLQLFCHPLVVFVPIPTNRSKPSRQRSVQPEIFTVLDSLV